MKKQKHLNSVLTDAESSISSLQSIKNELQDYIDQLTTLNAKLSPDGTLLMINAAAANVIGKPYSELVGRKFWEISHWSQPDEVNIRKAIEDASFGKWAHFDLNQPTVEGGSLVMDFSLKPVMDKNGQISYLMAEGHDITALRRNEDKYKELVQTANSIILRWDRSGNVRFFNEFAENFFGYSESEIIGRSVIGTIVPETDTAGRDLVEMMADICRNPERHETNVNENMRRNGERVWIAWTNRPVFDEHGQMTELLSVGVDLTARKHAEEKLLEEKKFSERIINILPGLFYMINQQGKEVWWNEYENQRFDHTFDENGNIDILRNVVSEDQDIAGKSLHEAFTAGQAETELRIRHKDGEVHNYYCAGVRVEVDKEPYIIGVGIDITELKRVEEEKRTFYREAIKSVTQGKLDLVACDYVENYVASAELDVEILTAQDVALARHQVEQFLQSKGMSGNGLGLFLTGVGEAMTNALKHAGEGFVYAGANGQGIWVAVSDNGPGIETLTLPSATLRRGFSTTTSMGMGYSIMLDVSDKVLLCTGSDGTTVILVKWIKAPKPSLSLADLPDTWA